jgi:hypothetical protein
MASAAHRSKIIIWSVLFLAVGPLLALNRHSYQLQEALVCLLFFSLAFALLTSVALLCVLVFSLIEEISRWVSAAAGGVSKLASSPEPHLKDAPIAKN